MAVGYLHSYANADHEARTRDILARRLPGLEITLSSEVSPEMREYERFSTACANAYVQPLMRGYLRSLTGAGGGRLFDDDFLDWLRANGCMEGLTLRAVPEGRVVHPNVPVVVVEGPLAMAQLIETPVLNHLNYQTLVATMDTVRSFEAVVAASVVRAELFPDIALGDAPARAEAVTGPSLLAEGGQR